MSRHEAVPAAATPVASPLASPAAAAGTAPQVSASTVAPPTGHPTAPSTATRPSRRRLVLAVVGAGALLAGAWFGWSWWTVVRFRVSTDDAYVKADVATIAARAAGHVVHVAVGDNARVAAGDLLAEIDPGDARLAVGAAEGRIATQKATIARIVAQSRAQEASIAQAEAQLAAARSDVARSEADFTRASDLVRSAAGTQQRLDQARADRDRVHAAVAVAEAGVAAARGSLAVFEAQRREAEQTLGELETALDKARRDLDFTRVVAPFSGVVGNRAVQLGQYVQPGTRLLALVPLDTVQIEANFKETQIARLKPGQPVEVVVDAFGSRRIEGRVASIAPASGAQFSLLPPENATGNFTKIVQRIPVRITLPAEVVAEGIVRPGMSVEVAVDTREAAR
jgi:membrane fusion protein (multidrug efflux system)